jgi:hypothetical protein
MATFVFALLAGDTHALGAVPRCALWCLPPLVLLILSCCRRLTQSFSPAPPTMEEVGAVAGEGSATFKFDAPGDYW